MDTRERKGVTNAKRISSRVRSGNSKLLPPGEKENVPGGKKRCMACPLSCECPLPVLSQDEVQTVVRAVETAARELDGG